MILSSNCRNFLILLTTGDDSFFNFFFAKAIGEFGSINWWRVDGMIESPRGDESDMGPQFIPIFSGNGDLGKIFFFFFRGLVLSKLGDVSHDG